jgi:hypothetical protein
MNGGATAARCTRCTGLVGGSQSGQNTTSRTPEVRGVVLRNRLRSPLNVEFDLAGIRSVGAYFLLPVPRGHALGEQLRDTDADTAC